MRKPVNAKVPRLKGDREAEAFLAQDLSALDFSQFQPLRFEFEKKNDQINMRVPQSLLALVKARKGARHPVYPADSGNPRTGNGGAKVTGPGGHPDVEGLRPRIEARHAHIGSR